MLDESANFHKTGHAARLTVEELAPILAEAEAQGFHFINGPAPVLHPDHVADLRKSGLTIETILAHRIHSVIPREITQHLGRNDARITSLLCFPYPGESEFCRDKVFPCDLKDKDGHGLRYLQRSGTGCRLYIPTFAASVLDDVNIPLRFTEGEKKALKACQEGYPTVALGGLWNFTQKGQKEKLLPKFDDIAIDGRTIILTPDAEVFGDREDLLSPVCRLGKLLEERGALVLVEILPDEKGRDKLDDFLVDAGDMASTALDDLQKIPLTDSRFRDIAKKKIFISTDMTGIIDAAEEALLALPDGPHIFQRLRQLCIVAHGQPSPAWIIREPDAPIVAYLEAVQLRERMNRAATWLKYEARGKEWKAALPPDWAVQTLLGRLTWRFPMLTDIISSPTIRLDGALIERAGYDPDTGLFLDTQGVTFPPIPTQPTKGDVEDAIVALREPFADFPFAHEYDLSAAIAAILSLVARPAIRGNVPLFAVRATNRGSGKGLLVDTITTIATGRIAPRWPQVEEEEERKRLLSLGLAGDACIHIDNVTTPLGSAALDMALTAETYTDRVLGLNKQITVPMNAVFFASGNNMQFKGDMARRVVPIDLESLLENPEDRGGFQHAPLLPWVAEQRPQLVCHALTILRAYFNAGCPKQDFTYGSFEGWSDLVRSVLVWADLPDPCKGRRNLEAESDDGHASLATLLCCWHACYESRAVTLKSVIQDVQTRAVEIPSHITPGNEWNDLLEALAAFDSKYDGKRLDGNRIGYQLRGIKGRVIEKQRLVQDGSHNRAAKWKVESI